PDRRTGTPYGRHRPRPRQRPRPEDPPRAPPEQPTCPPPPQRHGDRKRNAASPARTRGPRHGPPRLRPPRT
ncbi:hypothetical protein GTW38_07355, partial [Streptomyces sp. SID7804]|nr:hypothetical protein [Streptomyces sp. SID7804]